MQTGMIPAATGKQLPTQPASAGAAPAPDEQTPDDGTYDEAMGLLRKGLYEVEAARDLAASLKGAKDVSQALADATYQLVSIADEGTRGEIPEERLVELAMEVLGEVADIGEAAGLKIKGAEIAKAVQLMIVRFVTEQGLDATELQAAMSQVDVNQLGAEIDKMPADKAPAKKGA